MAKEEKIKKENREMVPVKQIFIPARFDPEKEVEFASKAAKALQKIVENKRNPVIINGQRYLEFEDWQTIARFFNLTVGTEKTERMIDENGKFKGYSATAVVYSFQGIKIGSAEASCLIDEKIWSDKPEFQLKSMAQTRAMAKALRSILGWVAVLANYNPTPAEEMNGGGYPDEPFPSRNPKRQATKERPAEKPATHKCSDCGKEITLTVRDYSKENYGMELCMECQKKYKKKT